jgi:hypothetical protein
LGFKLLSESVTTNPGSICLVNANTFSIAMDVANSKACASTKRAPSASNAIGDAASRSRNRYLRNKVTAAVFCLQILESHSRLHDDCKEKGGDPISRPRNILLHAGKIKA